MKGYKVPISASIGLAFYPIDGTDVDSLIKHADRAMHRVKNKVKIIMLSIPNAKIIN